MTALAYLWYDDLLLSLPTLAMHVARELEYAPLRAAVQQHCATAQSNHTQRQLRLTEVCIRVVKV